VVSRPYPGKRTAASVIKCRRTELVFSYKLEVPPSIGGVWPTQPKSQFCKVEIICCEGPQVFCHLRLARNLGEPHAALGELSVVFESQHCRKLILTSAVSSTQIESEGLNPIKDRTVGPALFATSSLHLCRSGNPPSVRQSGMRITQVRAVFCTEFPDSYKILPRVL
jgi:hypothetical protein